MARKLSGKVVLATHNSGKLKEMRELLAPYGVEVVSAGELGLPEPEENGTTFEANARIKAESASRELPEVLVLSDDSGLDVDALGGAPGVISARYAGPSATDADNRERVKRELAGRESTARFRCCMVLARDGQTLGVFNGAVEGRIITGEQGGGGFGYDPLFVPDGYSDTFGVLPGEVKNQLSHRARALSQVVEWLNANP